MKKITSALLCAALMLLLACPVLAADQTTDMEAAAAYLRERGVMVGDGNGDMRLNDGLNRTELAVLLTRLHGGPETNPEHYTWACYFTDVPQWAKPYVGYCTATLLVSGYGNQIYGANDPVTPAAACTVILRACGFEDGEGSLWTYNTACSYAAGLGLISQSTAQAPAITRGEMAVLIYRALLAQGAAEEMPAPPRQENAVVPAPEPEVSPDPGEYTIDTEHWSREDFSARANPAVFTGVYNRELYNTIRQTLVDVGHQDSPDYRYAYTMVSKEDYSAAVVNVLGRIDGVLRYEHYVPPNFTKYYEHLDYFAVSAEMPENFAAAYAYIQPAVHGAQRLATDSERVVYLNSYLRSLMVYEKGKAAGIARVFSDHSGEVAGACGSYALALNFLCSALDIPCFAISTETHSWNLVYVDGEWYHVDVSANDYADFDAILLVPERPRLIDQAPEATEFIKELLVPGSTK